MPGNGASKNLLIVSLLVGVVAVILFFVYDSLKEKSLRGTPIRVLKWTRDLDPGDEIIEADIGDVEVNVQEMKAVEDVVKLSERNLVPEGAHVNRKVSKNEFVRYNQIIEMRSATPSKGISVGMRAVTLSVDPYHTPGDLLRFNDRVDVIGLVSLRGKPAKAFVLIENLRILAVGGRSQSPDEEFGPARGRRYDPGMRTYRSISVEVKPEVAVQLADLMPRLRGKLWLVVRNPTDTQADFDNRLNPAVEQVLSQPLPDMM